MMLWKSHTLVTFTGILAITMNPLAACASVPGATFPDALEIYTGGMLKHRTITHWFPVYLIPLAIIGWFLYRNQGIWMTWKDVAEALQILSAFGFWLVFTLNCSLWFLVGCLCHIVEDTLTGYVPLWKPDDQHTIRILFYPGSPKELFFDLAFLFICFLFRIKDILLLLQNAQTFFTGKM